MREPDGGGADVGGVLELVADRRAVLAMRERDGRTIGRGERERGRSVCRGVGGNLAAKAAGPFA